MATRIFKPALAAYVAARPSLGGRVNLRHRDSGSLLVTSDPEVFTRPRRE